APHLLRALLERLGDRVVQQRAHPGGAAELGDSRAHRACAHDAQGPWELRHYRPLNSGLRFSRKAVMPSTRSSVAIASSNSRRSCASPAVRPVSPAASTACLAKRAASGGRLATVWARSIASSSQRSAFA